MAFYMSGPPPIKIRPVLCLLGGPCGMQNRPKATLRNLPEEITIQILSTVDVNDLSSVLGLCISYLKQPLLALILW